MLNGVRGGELQSVGHFYCTEDYLLKPFTRGPATARAIPAGHYVSFKADTTEEPNSVRGSRSRWDGSMTTEAVYIIDDDPSVRSALTNLVEAAGHVARSYASVDSFLESHGHILGGCFLLDIRLPGLNGLDFLTSMESRGLRLPVILITGHGDIPMTVRGMRAGAIDFLTKPFRNSEVMDAVSRAFAVDRERRIADSDRADLVSRYEGLSARERQVMALVTAGKMNKQVAGELGLSEITVKVHRGTLMKKMGIRTLADLVKLSEQLAVSSVGAGPKLQPFGTLGVMENNKDKAC
jgi:FixJ family two-component response regulator